MDGWRSFQYFELIKRKLILVPGEWASYPLKGSWSGQILTSHQRKANREFYEVDEMMLIKMKLRSGSLHNVAR